YEQLLPHYPEEVKALFVAYIEFRADQSRDRRLTRFYGEDENAVWNQIMIGLISYCLLLRRGKFSKRLYFENQRALPKVDRRS
ncbi:hypothetical protein SAMN05421868_1933, partial [Paenibacillus naphthalenovorans]